MHLGHIDRICDVSRNGLVAVLEVPGIVFSGLDVRLELDAGQVAAKGDARFRDLIIVSLDKR
jgi:hypothetical protein